MFAVFAEAFFDLDGQFACWRENQRTNAMGTVQQTVDNGEREGRCFSRSRLGKADEIASLEGKGDRFALNWRWLGVSGVANGVEHFAAQAKVGERDC